MEIILAENHGFCYGVKRAVEMANEAASSDGKSYTLVVSYTHLQLATIHV